MQDHACSSSSSALLRLNATQADRLAPRQSGWNRTGSCRFARHGPAGADLLDVLLLDIGLHDTGLLDARTWCCTTSICSMDCPADAGLFGETNACVEHGSHAALTGRLARGGALSHARMMFIVSEVEAAAIRTAYAEGGELSAAVELHRLFPGLANNEAGNTQFSGISPLSEQRRVRLLNGLSKGDWPRGQNAVVRSER